MTDLEQAKERLQNSNLTCVLCKGEEIIMSTKTGISPMLDLLAEHEDLTGYAAADKIIGKAAAMLFYLGGVRELYGEVVSRSAVEFAKKHEMTLSYGELVETIINRKGDGPCPMELTVAKIEDCKEGYRALKQKRAELLAQRAAK